VALAAVVGLVPAFAQVGYAQAVPAEQAPVTLPQGDELSDEELHAVEGGDAATVLGAAMLTGVIAAAGTVAHQLATRREVNWAELGYDVATGVVGGAAMASALGLQISRAVGQPVISAMTRCARAASRVATAAAATAKPLLERAPSVLNNLHVGLHENVTVPARNVVNTVWNWFRGR